VELVGRVVASTLMRCGDITCAITPDRSTACGECRCHELYRVLERK
jgi:hypothetical protein